MICKLRRFLRLPRADRWLLLQSIPLLLLVDLSSRLFGYKTIHRRMIHPGQSPTRAGTPQIAQARYLAAIIQAANSLMCRNSRVCSLVLAWLLIRKGIAAEIVFDAPEAPSKNPPIRAWVEVNGIKINEAITGNELFTPLYTRRIP